MTLAKTQTPDLTTRKLVLARIWTAPSWGAAMKTEAASTAGLKTIAPLSA